MKLEVKAQKIGTKLHKLEIFFDNIKVGEYERAQEADIVRKKREVQLSQDLLHEIYRKHGDFTVRWCGQRKSKIIRVMGSEVGTIPKEYWQRPSWY